MPTLREVYEKWGKRDYGPDPITHHLTEREEEAMLLDCWLAIRAAVEERCVWKCLPQDMHGYVSGWAGCDGSFWFIDHVLLDMCVRCPRCGAPIERKEAPDV